VYVVKLPWSNRKDWSNLSYEKPDLIWDSGDVAKSLHDVHQYAEGLAEGAIQWYYRKKVLKARLSQSVRYGAIGCTAFAGLVPVLGGLWPNALAALPAALKPASGNLFVSLLVGLAASLVALDRSGGYSTGWIRYIRTGAELQKLLHEYRLDRIGLMADANMPPARVLARTREFVVAVQSLVIRETETWATEFESNLAQMEKSAKEQSDKQVQELKAKLDEAQPGSLFVTVKNLRELDGGKFTIALFDNRMKVAEAADQTAMWQYLGLAAGVYTAQLSATIAGKQVSKTIAVTIERGKPRQEELVLAEASAAAK
jgi:hypothetical protein